MNQSLECSHCHEPLAKRPRMEALCPKCLLLLGMGADLSAHRKIGPFEVLEEIGRGGMGVVYKAYHARLHRVVALKVLSRALAEDAVYVQRFEREAQSAAGLNHPNVVTVYDVGSDNGEHYIAMEFVDGPNLQQRLKAEGALPWTEALRVMQQALRGLAAAHKIGVIHRDIKPHNLMQNGAGLVKVADFGLARKCDDPDGGLTATGDVVGTPAFMSPEQALGEDVDVRTDVFALGAVLHALLCGRAPFDGKSRLEIMQKILYEIPHPPESPLGPIPGPVLEIVRRALEKRREDRYGSAEEMAAAVEATLDGGGMDATRLVPASETGGGAGRAAGAGKKAGDAGRTGGKWLAALGGVVVCLALAGAGIWWMLRDSPGTRQVARVAGPVAPLVTPVGQPTIAPTLVPVRTPAPIASPTPVAAAAATPVLLLSGLIRDPALDGALRKVLSFPPERPIEVGDLQRLDVLDVPNLGISTLAGLEHAVNLEVLNVSGNPIRDGDLDVIARFPLMHNLMITECPGVTDEGLLRLRGLDRVHILWLSYLKIQGPGLDIVRNMREIKQVYVNFTQVTDEWMDPLADLEELDILMIRGAPRLTDAALRTLSRSRSIQHLSVGEIRGITDAGVAELARMRQLRSLEMYRSDNVTVKGYQALAALPMLEEIQIGDTRQVTDEVIAALGAYPALRVLQIQGKTALTPAAFHHVIRLPLLRVLVLPEKCCEPQELDQLRAAMPQCKVMVEPPGYNWPRTDDPSERTW